MANVMWYLGWDPETEKEYWGKAWILDKVLSLINKNAQMLVSYCDKYRIVI